MRLLDSIPTIDYQDPWNQTLSERLRMLAAGRRRVAYFYEKADNSTFRYRCYNMAQVLDDGSGDISASYFFLDDLHRLNEIADLADLLVICRTRYDHRISRLINAFRCRHKRILYDTDDLVFDTDYCQLILTTLDQDLDNAQIWDTWFGYLSRLGATLKQCDGAITTTIALAEKITAFARIPAAVVPNFLNREQLEFSDQIYAAKRQLKLGEDGLIHFGYFSGSPSHNKDFALAVPALESAMADDPRLGVVVVGYIEAGAALEKFGTRVKHVPFQDFINLQLLIGSVEFNLMPLQFNEFTHCKSELKYFDAAIVGTVSIASPTHSYAKAIRHGDNGYLAQAHQWEAVIQKALNELDGYSAMAERGYLDAREKYAWFNQRDCILAALGFA